MYNNRNYRIHVPLMAFLSAITLSACAKSVEQPDVSTEHVSSDQTFLALELKDQGVAPELTNEVWLNADSPLRLGGLQGKVILLDFWSFG